MCPPIGLTGNRDSTVATQVQQNPPKTAEYMGYERPENPCVGGSIPPLGTTILARDGEVHEASAEGRLPVRRDPLRDRRNADASLHLPLHRLSAPDEQRV